MNGKTLSPSPARLTLRTALGALLALSGAAVALAPNGWAQGSAATAAAYTEEQADRGDDAYEDNCAGCHGATLGGEGEAPGLIGSGFRTRWFSETALTFFAYISTSMPQQAPGTLEPQTYADIMAYILQRNGYPGGDAELPADTEILQTLTIPERPE
jgi:mono/diheme cytochrome c family protein